VLDAVDAVIPAIEIVSPRLDRLAADSPFELVADFGANGGVVLGKPLADFHSLDFATLSATMHIADVPKQQGIGALALGNPLNVLEWLANTLRSSGGGILAGQFVMTGTLTGLHAPAPGETAIADFGELGQVQVVFE
jgi:2-keto-4-pentenoate hydratase